MTDAERVRALVARWIGAGLNRLPAKEPPFDVEDGGVPPDMWDGEPDEDGWVSWRAVPSLGSMDDLHRIEERVGAALPPLVRAWLTTVCMGPIEGPFGRLVALWSDSPFRELERAMEAWSPIDRAGYLVIGEADNDVGPLCLDLGASRAVPVVAFDHERLIDLGSERFADRQHVAPLAEVRWASFNGLVTECESLVDAVMRSQ